jgi:hypothetical protein
VWYIPVQQLVEEYHLVSLKRTKKFIQKHKKKEYFLLHHLMIVVEEDRCFAFFHACSFTTIYKFSNYKTQFFFLLFSL